MCLGKEGLHADPPLLKGALHHEQVNESDTLVRFFCIQNTPAPVMQLGARDEPATF